MDDLISEFITETSESLGLLDSELIKLEKNPDDTAILSNIFRVMHTIKGTCGFLGLPRLESVAHAGEDVLGKIRDKELEATPQAISLVLESLDQIKHLLDYLSENGSEEEGDDSELVARLNHFAESGEVLGDAPAAATAAEEAPLMEAAPVETAPAGGNDFPHFMGEDDPEIAEAIARILEKEQAERETAAVAGMAAEAAPKAAPVKAKAPAAAKPAPAKKAAASPKQAETADTKNKDAAANSTQSIRVNIDVLENLMQMVSELVLTRNQLMQIVRGMEDNEFQTPLQQLSYITTELQEGIMQTRMQPIGNAWSKFPRLIRDLSLELGKKIELEMHGEETELDRQLLEVIKDPLTHMVRNSCDHGIEEPHARLAAGKPESGTVRLSAYHEGGHIIIEIRDDGKGLNVERIKEKMAERKLASETAIAEMSDKEVMQYIFAPGFSTAEQVTAVSGRGVGMDVVKTNIEKIGGTIELDSTWGKGSMIAIKIPLTLAIVSVLLVEVAKQRFAIPQINVSELVRVSPTSEMRMEMINGAPIIRLRNRLLPLAMLGDILGFKEDHAQLMQRDMYVAVCKVGGTDFGILVDRVFDTEEIVVKPVASILKEISIYSGNTILGDGSVIMILDPNGLAKHITQSQVASQAAAKQEIKHKDREQIVSFLLFSVGDDTPKSVPLELVSRLEEIDVKTIEIAGGKPVVQYRGELMQLVQLANSMDIPDEGMIEVIVFNYDGSVIGLVVEEILDIVHDQFSIKLSTKENRESGYLGTMVIGGKSTDVVDVAHLLSSLHNSSEEAKKRLGSKVQNKSLLLVEDSPFFRNLTAPYLSDVGYQVTTADSAEAALQMLQNGSKHFDIIVTDIEMPGMDGFELANACHDIEGVNNIPIIAYTATVSEEVRQRSEACGMLECIVKTDRAGLLNTVSQLLIDDLQVRH